MQNRINPEGKDLNALSSGRIDVWQEYIKALNFLGNDGRVTLLVNGQKLAAHNAALDIAYRTGIINGIMFLIFETITVIYAMAVIFKREYKEPYLFFSAAVTCSFFIFAALEVTQYPFNHPPVLLYYAGIAPLIFIKVKFKNN